MGIGQGEFVKEGETNEGHKGDDAFLHSAVGVREEEKQAEQCGNGCPDHEGDAEEHLQGDGSTQNFGQRGGNGGGHGTPQYGTALPTRQIARGSLRKAEAGNDAQVRHVVLQHDEHEGGKSYDPQQGVAESGAGCKIGSPVAGIDKAYGDEEAGAYVAQDVESAIQGAFPHPPMFTPMCSKFSQHK